MTTISTDDVVEFLGIIGEKGFGNKNTINGLRTACAKFFEILEPDQKNVEYVQENLDVIKARFANLNRDVAGTTVDEYARRVQLALSDFAAWTTDRSGWERSISAKQNARPSSDGERKPRTSKTEKPSQEPPPVHAQPAADPSVRIVEFPLRPDFDLKITLPRNGITMAELRKLAWFLLPYATDFDPATSPRDTFPMLDRTGTGEVRN
jgi:hypothetical protein